MPIIGETPDKMTLQIPGYYFDSVKNKYFKIEKSQTAGTVSWSSEAVKRRKIETKAAETKRKREHELRRHIKRSPLWRDIITSGIMNRELGGFKDEGELGASSWAAGVVSKGEIRFIPARGRSGNLECLWVGGEEEKLGLGVAYTTLDQRTVTGSYIPTNVDGNISFDTHYLAEPRRRPIARHERVQCPQMSSITYHKASHRMLVTSRVPDASCGMYFFSPPVNEGEWMLGDASHYERLWIRHRQTDEWVINNCTPAPPSSPNLLCALATNAGVLRVTTDERVIFPNLRAEAPERIGQTLHTETPAPFVRPDYARAPPDITQSLPRNGPGEIFDVDFQKGGHNVLLAGGRQSKLWVSDTRMEAWHFHAVESTVAKIKSLSENMVLVNCLRNNMATYDLRFPSQPIVKFTEHKNEAHVHIGFDICPELNVVAAAQDNGTVELFSLKSGRRLKAPGLEEVKMETPVKALMFKTLPGEKSSSLFVGEGSWIQQYSWGKLMDDEY